MATITHETREILANNGSETKWLAMGSADVGQSVEITELADKTLAVSGTFGGATVALMGSIDNITFDIPLNDVANAVIAITSASAVVVQQNVRYVRPETSGGTGSSINVALVSI